MLQYHEIENIIIAEITDENFIISKPQDILELLAEAGYNNCNRLIIREYNLHPDFFSLHTGFAGEILQKISNYRSKLAIIGDFSKYRSKSLQDLIRESNRGNSVFFVESRANGISKLTVN